MTTKTQPETPPTTPTATLTATTEQTSSLRMIVTLTLVSMLSGLTVVSVYLTTHPIIEENKRRAIEAAVLNVIPDATSYQTYTIADNQLTKVTSPQRNTQLFYVGYDKNNQSIGIASPAMAQGYADKVHLIYGYRFDCECITGIKIIKHAETPGLGDKVITDKNFVANFNALDAKLNPDKSSLRNAIVTVKHGTKQNPWEIDAITGATITSRTVGHALNNSATVLLPQVATHADQLQQ